MKKLILALTLVALTFSNGCANTPKTLPLDPPADAAAVNTPVLKSIPASVAPADVFKTIVSAYKGSVVFVDLWATWCPPCRQAMKSVDEIKPALQAKGCKFVYVTGETSPRSDFDAMYKTIDGDHFYVTNEQFKGLCDQFQALGIPHYILVDKAGNVLWQNSGYPGNDEVQSQIEVALAK